MAPIEKSSDCSLCPWDRKSIATTAYLSLSRLASRDHVSPVYPPPCTAKMTGLGSWPSAGQPATYTPKEPLSVSNALRSSK